ncbi:HotDog domain-containing protein [Fusarium solani]|uniref:HotDog domain-containing protein n=2 Tax=Fusarium solani TaxID=169388 RepID=A0A9P9L711_FUSSL|nr:HotDog domain-containing protein [Fusarium solani]KAH7275074.1 HotDog domain-containing protein [Fusarium solani]
MMLVARSVLKRPQTALSRACILRLQPPAPRCREHRIGPAINIATHRQPFFNHSFSSRASSKMTFPPIDSTIVCPALNVLFPGTPPDLFASELTFFASVPWTASLLSAPNTIPFLPSCRNPASSAHDQLFGLTLNNERGLSHLISFFHAPSTDVAKDPSHSITETVTLVSLGDGLSGFPGVTHGGMIASLLDESMGTIFDLNSTLRKQARAFQTPNVTGGLDIKFLKPVPTNGVYYITSTVDETDGRKTRIRCDLKDKDGEVLAKCSSKWVALKSNL